MIKSLNIFLILVAIIVSSNLCIKNRLPFHPRQRQWLAKEEAQAKWGAWDWGTPQDVQQGSSAPPPRDPWGLAKEEAQAKWGAWEWVPRQPVQQGSSAPPPRDPWGLAKEGARFNPPGFQHQGPTHHYPGPPTDNSAPPTQNQNPGSPVQQPNPPQGDTNTNTPNQSSTGVKYRLAADGYGTSDFMMGSIYQEHGSTYLGKWDLMTVQATLLSGTFTLHSDSHNYFLVAQRRGTTLEGSIYDVNLKMVGTFSFQAYYGSITNGQATLDTSNPEPLFRIDVDKQSQRGDYYIQVNSKPFYLGDVEVWLAMQDRYFGNIRYKDQTCNDTFEFDSSNGPSTQQFTVYKQPGCKKPRVFGQNDDYTLKAVQFKETDTTWTYGQEPMYPY